MYEYTSKPKRRTFLGCQWHNIAVVRLLVVLTLPEARMCKTKVSTDLDTDTSASDRVVSSWILEFRCVCIDRRATLRHVRAAAASDSSASAKHSRSSLRYRMVRRRPPLC